MKETGRNKQGIHNIHLFKNRINLPTITVNFIPNIINQPKIRGLV